MSQKTLDEIITSDSKLEKTHTVINCKYYQMEINPSFLDEYYDRASKAVVDAYVDNEYLSKVFEREGFNGVKELFDERFPPKSNEFGVRSGDFGEITAHMVLQDFFNYLIPVIKLRYKTNWEKAAFGIDVIAFHLDSTNPGNDRVVFSEVKTSRTKDYGIGTVFNEIIELEKDDQPLPKQKMRNAVRFVSERLFNEGNFELERRIYRFLDCYNNPQYVEAFYPFLVRDKSTWDCDALDDLSIASSINDKITLCIFVYDNIEALINEVYEKARNWSSF